MTRQLNRNIFWAATLFLHLPWANFCFGEKVAVLYPEIRDPYKQVFLSIAEGVSDQNKGTTLQYALEKSPNVEALQTWLIKNKIESIIALGSRSLKILPELPLDIPVIVGAITGNRQTGTSARDRTLTGISLTPSPRYLFQQLRRLRPNISTIYVVDLSRQGEGLMREAKVDATRQNMGFERRTARDMHEAAQHYREIIEQIDPGTEAIWLAQSGRQIGSAVLNDLLEAAWRKNFVVFSSHFSDIKRGVFFALYPNNQSMGMRLAALLKQTPSNPGAKPNLLFVENLRVAVNLRTADHLGRHFSQRELETFDFMYPPR